MLNSSIQISDEIDCNILSTDRSYIKEVPPPAADGGLVEVKVAVDVLSVLDITEVDNTITLQIEMKLTWLDRRLTMYNLKVDKDLNTLTQEFRNRIWIPEVVFYNTQKKLKSQNDEDAFATITRQGRYQGSPRSQLENALFFKGAENPITISRVYDSEFLCDFNMAMFPFDTQQCSIILIMKGNTNKFVEMTPDKLKYIGPVDLTQYFIKTVAFGGHAILTDVQGLKVDIIFGRRVLATILTTYLPTILLCFVCFSTNYFKAFFFEAIVTVNLTSLLVLTTLFISVFNSLPTTAYVKMIDIWLIFTLFIPFCEVLLHTFIDSLREEYDRSINHHGKAVKIEPSERVKDSTDGLQPEQNSAVAVNINGRSVQKRAIKVAPKNLNESINSNYSRDARLIHRDEEKEVAARRRHYREGLTVRNEKLLNVMLKITTFGLPAVYITFVIVYFVVGFSHYNTDKL